MTQPQASHVLDYYAMHFTPGHVDLSSSCPQPRTPGESSYPEPGGLPELRERVAALYPGLTADDIVITNGASEALAAAALAFVRPGSVVSAGPAVYPSFRELAARLGGRLVDEPPSPGVDLLVLNNPTVPTGKFVSMREIADAAYEAGTRLVVDEVYLPLGRHDHPPVATLSTSAISIGDLSKPLGLGNLRIGWAATRDRSALQALQHASQLLTGGPSVPAMIAACSALSTYQETYARYEHEAATNAPGVFALLDEFGWTYELPEAGWTFVAHPTVGIPPANRRAIGDQGSFLLPTDVFGIPGGFRISLFAPPDVLRRALQLDCRPPLCREAVVLLAKAPAQSKSRLAAAIGPQSAALLAPAFLADSIALLRQSGRQPVVAYHPAEAESEFTRMAPGMPLVLQPGGDLGARILAAMQSAFDRADRADRAVLIGSDTPHLPPALIAHAFSALDRADLVIGPATDGGFYLIGSRRPLPATLFAGVEWSTETVHATVIANARRLGLTVECLAPVTDIDDLDSLLAARSAILEHAPATAAALASLSLPAGLHA